MTIEILPLDFQTLTYSTAVMDEDGNVLQAASYPRNRYVAARRWARRMQRRYGGTIIDHTIGSRLRARATTGAC